MGVLQNLRSVLRRSLPDAPARLEKHFYTRPALARHPFADCITVGDHTYGSPDVICFDRNTRLVIGKYCSIAGGVTFLLGGEHRSDWQSTYPFTALSTQWPEAASISGHPASKGNVIVGNDVWLGYRATILSGVKIGDGAIVAANTTVAKDVDDYSIVAGNPARHIRYRFSANDIKRLKNIAWWTWSDDDVAEALPYILSPNTAAFFAWCERR